LLFSDRSSSSASTPLSSSSDSIIREEPIIRGNNQYCNYSANYLQKLLRRRHLHLLNYLLQRI
jgi:hypothetical protein